ncbi:PREDICTED: death ligand signal enhancer [Elephantulus edwardii]|uniref:death ligand signal enhancer n=1 Tax=Elephantulus edwardii TaxID=28737 RepID=UPI0003F0A422|nr:PREDICTED: death ligand signal enhancer [Elephantulus edwardii]
MWRLPGVLGRAFHRLPRSGFQELNRSTNPQDGPPATSSNLLVPVSSLDSSSPHGTGPSTSRGSRTHGWKDAFQWLSSPVSHKTLWDALSWGTLAVLALQLARQIHFQASLPGAPLHVEPCSWRRPLHRFLSSSWWHFTLRRHILPIESPVPRHTGLREARLGQEGPSAQAGQLSSHGSLRIAGVQDPEEDHSNTGFRHATSSFEPKARQDQPLTTGDKQEQDKSKTLSLEEAVTSIQQLFQLSVSIAFNFLGTENMKNGDYLAAFSYFQKAADRGYNKAQYNVGLCYEHGRGTPRDLSKAVLYYQLAAGQGHSLARYRYARCLLQDPTSLGESERQRALVMLKQVADSGLREAQAFLGVLLTKEPYVDEQRAVKYLWLAANNGDSQSRYHLGICYEKGLGVQRNLGEAIRCYQQSAALGNKPAQERLQTLFSMETTALAPSDLAITGLKSFSSPSLCSLNTLLAGASHLPHAWSTGNVGLCCRSGHLGPHPGASSSNVIPPHSHLLERSLVRLGFG